MNELAANDRSVIEQWIEEKLDIPSVENRLLSMGIDRDKFSAYLKEYKKRLAARKQFRGFVFAAIGAMTGFISCLLSVLNPVPELFNLFLYGFTSVAIILVVAGLYFLFE